MQTAHLSLLAAARPGLAPHVTVMLGNELDLALGLQRLLAGCPQSARVLRVGNPLRSPLTIERILIQAGKEEVGLLTDDAADEAIQRLCQRRSGETQVVLVIEQAETLGLGAVRTLSRLIAPNGRVAGGDFAPLHLVLIGDPSFKHMLADPLAATLRGAAEAATPLPRAVSQAAAPAAAPATARAAPAQAASEGAPAPRPTHSIPILAHPALARARIADPEPIIASNRQMHPVLQAALVLSILSALGAGAVAGLPYALQWLGMA